MHRPGVPEGGINDGTWVIKGINDYHEVYPKAIGELRVISHRSRDDEHHT